MSDTLDFPQEVNFSGAGEVRIQGKKLLGHQLLALFLKRFHHVRRSKKGFISEVSVVVWTQMVEHDWWSMIDGTFAINYGNQQIDGGKFDTNTEEGVVSTGL